MNRKDAYWRGYWHGRRLHDHHPNVDHEPALRLEVKLTDGGPGRAFALGELRGYRAAAGAPHPIVEAHKVLS